MTEREQVERAISALETQRATLDDAVVDTMIAAAREKLDALGKAQVTPQRKQVTVLFADVSGFMTMAETMDVEELSDTINALWARLDGVITAYGGTIDKHMGDGVMALFGAPTAREDDPEQAIRAALAIQQEMKNLQADQATVHPSGRKSVQSLAVRIGINTGPVLLGQVGTASEYTAMGNTVNLARRLEQAAPVGGILISYDTYCHVRGVFSVQALEPIRVRGKTEAVRVYVVREAKPRAFRVPTRGVEGVETRMIGRDAELESLQKALYTVMEERKTRVVTVVGDAGIGKSRLLDEFENWVELWPENVVYLKGRASHRTSNLPYSLIRDLCAFHFEITSNDSAAVAREKLEQGIARLMGADARMKAHLIGHLIGLDFSESPYLRGMLSDARQIRDRAFRYITQFFAAATTSSSPSAEGTEGRPGVLLVEDLHWADDGSLDLIEHLARVHRHSPLLIVALTRPELFERRPTWGKEPAVHTRLELRPLSRQDSHRLVKEILRQVRQIPPHLCDLILDGAEGNPFYIEELINMLVKDGVIVKGKKQWCVKLGRLTKLRVPPTLTGVLQARLDGLPPLERETLQRAAVVGRVFWDGAVERLNGDSRSQESETARALAALRSKGLIFKGEMSTFVGQQEYVFKHTMLHEVTYESVLRRQRRAYHARVAAWLVAQSRGRAAEYAGLIGQHYVRAGKRRAAAEWYGRAGRQTQDTCTPEAAAGPFLTCERWERRPLAHLLFAHSNKRRLKVNTRKLFSGLIILTLLLPAVLTGSPAPTRAAGDSAAVSCNVSGLIDSDTTWSSSECDPYVVTGNLSVQSGATLIIQASTTVKFDGLNVLAVAGTLVVRGTATSPITFTSNLASPAPGDWGFIHFADPSTDATFDGDGSYTGGSIIQYAVIEYAGGASMSENGALRIEASSPFIDHNTIRDNDGDGIHVWSDGAPRITDNTIAGNSGYGIYAYYDDWNNNNTAIISNNTVTTNDSHGIYVYYDHWNDDNTVTISHNAVTGNDGHGIYVYYNYWNDNNTATISNNTVTNNSSRGIYVYYGDNDNNEVTISSNNPISGNDAGGISIDMGSGSSNTAAIVSNTISGNSASCGGGIYVDRGNPTIQSNIIIGNIAAQENKGGGIYLSNGSRPIINYNDLYGNVTGDPANTPNDIYNGNTFSGVAVNAENNDWVTTDPSVIEDRIWHFMDDPSLSIVDYIPFRTSAVPVESVTITGPTTGVVNTIYSFSATVSPVTATQPITYVWQATGQAPVTHTGGGLSDTVTLNWSTPGTQAITVTTSNAECTVADTHLVAINVPPTSADIVGPTTGLLNTVYTFSATVSPVTATQPITYVWRATGQSPVTHIGGLSDTVSFTWSTSGTRAITVTATNVGGMVSASHTITIAESPTDGDAFEPDDTCAQANALATNGTAQPHTFHQYADEDWAHFMVTSGITYVLQANSTNSGADLVLELYDACGGNLEGLDDAFGADARIIFSAPSSGIYYLKALNHDPAVYGPDVTYELSVRQSFGGVALIVAGHDDNHNLQDNILHCTNTAFRTFLLGGLPKTNLRYLSDVDDARTDADGDEVSDVYADSSSANVQDAIINWAASLADANTPFYLYLMDHGAIDTFFTDGRDDTIAPGELDDWLMALEDATGAPVNVIYEACHSGSFIDELSKPARKRVIIASTSSLKNAYPSRYGALFSDAFFTQLRQCSDLYTSFQAAKQAVEATRLWQIPWLDDNGDGEPNSGDGDLARQRGLNCGFDHPPAIGKVTPPSSIVDGDGVLRAQVQDDSGIEMDVWAVVYPPDFEEPAPTGNGTIPELGLPRVLLSDSDGDREYVGLYEDFTEDGVYHVVVYAQDAGGNQALPVVMTVRTKWWVYLPLVMRSN